jgi:GNAT superfamily N-acetyltransferase
MNLEERAKLICRPYHTGGIDARGWKEESEDLADGYTLHVGIYKPDKPRQERRLQASRGPCLMLVHNGSAVGFGRFGALYILPSHRGRGHGARIYRGLLERWPEWAAEHYAKGLKVTEGGEASVRRAWRELEASGRAPAIRK